MKNSKLSDYINKSLGIKESNRIFDREDIYTLLNSYLKGEIDEVLFEEGFYLMYTRDGVMNMTNEEEKIFDDLGKIIHRFSPYEEDRKLDPKAFTTKEQVRQAAIKAKEQLQDQ